jgi:hypothetical protein
MEVTRLKKNTHNSGRRVLKILQNIEDILTLHKHVKRARDPISMVPLTKSQMKPQKNKQISQILIK